MTTPVWLRAVMVREGDDVVTRCCIVAEGQYFPVEVRVNVPRLIAQARALGIDRVTSDKVGGFGSWLKKAVKKVTHNKVTKAVGSVVKKVANSPVAMIANPGLILAAHTASKVVTGKGLVKGKLGQLADLGAHVTANIVAPGAGSAALTAAQALGGALRTGNLAQAIPSALNFVGPQAAAALGVGLRAVNVAKTGSTIASVAKMAQQKVDVGKMAAQAVAQKKLTPAQAMPAIKAAAALRANVVKVAPALAKQVIASQNVKNAFSNIVVKARAGNKDAQLASNVIAKSAELVGTIQRLEQQNQGGVAGLLVTAQGRIVRAPKGKFIQKPGAAPKRPDILYRGRGMPELRGSFSAVSGSGWSGVGASSGWGGQLDPGNDIDSPLPPVTNPDGRWMLDDYSTVAGVLTP